VTSKRERAIVQRHQPPVQAYASSVLARRLLLAFGASGLVLFVASTAPPAAGASHAYRCPSAPRPPAFAHYWLGPSFEGLPLRYRDFHCSGASTDSYVVMRTNFSSVIYGDCDASDGGCAPPLEIQTWPACDRSFADYDFSPLFFPKPRLRRLRGVPSARFKGGDERLELYTGDVTVAIWGDGAGRVARAAEALRTTPQSPVSVAPNGPLPRAVRGHIRGTLFCGLRRPRLRVARATRRAVTIAARVRTSGFLSGELRLAGKKPDELGIPPGNVDFAVRVRRGAVKRRIRLRRAGRYAGTIRLTALDGRHSRERRIRFVAR
jgi:hypothetical protein